MKLRFERLFAIAAFATLTTALPAFASDEAAISEDTAYGDELMTNIDENASEEGLAANEGDETAYVPAPPRHRRDFRRDRHRDHRRWDSGPRFRIRFGYGPGWWGPRWNRDHNVTCWSRNASGRTFAARGWASPRLIQDRAMRLCYSNSRAPRTCRPLGCR